MFDLRRNPLLVPALALALGLALRANSNGVVVCLIAALLSLAALGGALRPLLHRGGDRGHGARHFALLFLIPFVLGFVAGGPAPPAATLPRGPHYICARVISTPRPLLRAFAFEDDALPRVSVKVQLLTQDGAARTGWMMAHLPGTPDLGRGDQIDVYAVVEEQPSSLIIRHAAHIAAIHHGGNPWGLLDRLRRRVRQSWESRFDARTASWLAALLVGDRGLLAENVPVVFRHIGQTHLLAISGQHFAVLCALLLFICERSCTLGGRRAPLVAGAVLLVYGGLAGADASVMRATIFGVLGAVAALRGRIESLWNHLALAFLVLVASHGEDTSTPAFLLTFSAVAGIALFGARTPAPRVVESTPLLRGARSLLRAARISCGAWIGASIPLLWYTPEVVPLGPIFALIFSPLLAAILGTGIVAIASIPGFDYLLEPILSFEIFLLEQTAYFLDDLPGTPWCWPPLPPFALALALAAVAAPRFGRHGLRWSAWLLTLGIVAALAPLPAPGIDMPALGRGQAVLVAGDRGTLLLDAGSIDRTAGGAHAIRAALRARGRDHIDVVVLSHAHADHVLALFDLTDSVSVGSVVVGPRFEESPLGHSVGDRIRRAGVPLIHAHGGEVFTVGAFSLEIRHPPRDYPSVVPNSLNDDSLVVRVAGEGLSLLACGDLQEAGLALFGASPPADFIVLPHHGRFTPALTPLLAHTHARLALAATSGSMPPRTARLLAWLGIPFAHTGRDGSVSISRIEGVWRLCRVQK